MNEKWGVKRELKLKWKFTRGDDFVSYVTYLIFKNLNQSFQRLNRETSEKKI
jgi:hypothetical protein